VKLLTDRQTERQTENKRPVKRNLLGGGSDVYHTGPLSYSILGIVAYSHAMQRRLFSKFQTFTVW